MNRCLLLYLVAAAAGAALLCITAPPLHAATFYENTVLADNPAGYWRLDEAAGSTTVQNIGSVGAAGNGNVLNGAALGSVGAIVGDNNTAATFVQGPQQRIEVPFNAGLNPSPAFSVEVWARVTGGTNHRSPLTSRGDFPQEGFIFYANPTNVWEFWTGSGQQVGWQVIGGPPVVNDEWAHLVGTYDGATQRFYVNGIEVGTPLVGQGFGPNNGDVLRIGAGATEGPGNFFFHGDVDEVAVYGTALSPERIAAHYTAGINPIPEPGTIVLAMLGFAGLLLTLRRRPCR